MGFGICCIPIGAAKLGGADVGIKTTGKFYFELTSNCGLCEFFILISGKKQLLYEYFLRQTTFYQERGAKPESNFFVCRALLSNGGKMRRIL
ncbi:hypothetical protein [Phaeodactylibacter luteus]|uniref:hypothetical protein n=1 Tax=Phaeodactylibacter luteus TaxID=1564516 RepID=UPI0011BF4E2D|nr:hypothetical protein [Phaeodactylibacter luteus]